MLSHCYLHCVFCSLLRYKYAFNVFNYSFHISFLVFAFCFFFVCSFFFCIVLRNVSTDACSCFSFICVKVCGPLPQGGSLFAVNKHHVISQTALHQMSQTYSYSLRQPWNRGNFSDLLVKHVV